MKVKDILHVKGNAIFSIAPHQSVLEAIKLMAEKNIGGVLIIESDQLIGIFTERDYARKVILKGRSSAEIKVSEVMVSNLYTVNTENEIADCMKLMTNKSIRHLPVFENEKLVGIISIGDVVKTLIEEQKDTIQHLEQYISGT